MEPGRVIELDAFRAARAASVEEVERAQAELVAARAEHTDALRAWIAARGDALPAATERLNVARARLREIE